MRSFFHPRLVNPPFDDPGVFVPFLFQTRAVLFDLGEIYSLSSRDILKISHVFISHTHMDHFIGFDRLLRLFLGREKTLYMYGPAGFLKNLEGRLSSYTWNLVNNYSYKFAIHAVEVHSDYVMHQDYLCQKGFKPVSAPEKKACFDGVLLKESALEVCTQILDHGLPCLGFSLKERFHVNIIKEQVTSLGMNIGPWLGRFKTALYSKLPPETFFMADAGRFFTLGQLAKKIAIITPGQKIVYITDVSYTQPNIEKILKLAENADHLFIEACFLNADEKTALQKHHLTAHQAGTLAGQAKVRQLTVFHFSPRYADMENEIQAEAQKSYKAALL